MNLNQPKQMSLIFAALVLMAGIAYDLGLIGTAMAFMVLSVVVLSWLLLRYLDGARPSNSPGSMMSKKSKPIQHETESIIVGVMAFVLGFGILGSMADGDLRYLPAWAPLFSGWVVGGLLTVNGAYFVWSALRAK